MAVKFLIKTKNGNALIDETYRTLSLINIRNFPQANFFEIKRESIYSVLAISCQTEGVMMPGASNISNFSRKLPDYYTTRGDLKIYEFADVEIQRHQGGVNIRNGTTGVLIFSSLLKPLRVVHHASGVISNLNQNSILFEAQLDSSRKYAVVLGNLPFRLEVGSNVVSARTMCVTTTDAGYVKVQFKQFNYEAVTGAVRGSVNTGGNYSFQIIDVTHY